MVSLTPRGEHKPGGIVYGADSERIGALKEHGPDYLLVREGMLFAKDRYLPAAAIANYLGDDVYLSIPRDIAEGLSRESLPPAGDPWYTGVDATDVTTPIAPEEPA